LLYTDNITIGTDSLASNHTLSVLNELITLHKHFPDITLEKLINWGTLNGAKALNLDKETGSFETGKKPGVNLVYQLDLQNMKLTKDTKVKPLM
jgi:cytosine/adenosine deaminase-related metal-dependent hydrolase